MTTQTTIRFQIQSISLVVLERVRAAGIDAAGIPVEYVTATGGEPLRCCLRDALPGEELILFGYEPNLPPSPYREVGPVFAHRAPCAEAVSTYDYPSDWRGRPQVLRGYDSRGWIHEATKTHDGHNPESVVAEMLADPSVAQIHSRNIAYGCYMFAITRANGQADQPSLGFRRCGSHSGSHG